MKFVSSQVAIGFHVLLAGLCGYVDGQRGRWRLLVPFDGFEVVTHELLVVGILRFPGRIGVERPEARGIRGERLIGESNAGGGAAKLKLRVGDDDAALARA